jgi:hypothetical protein
MISSPMAAWARFQPKPDKRRIIAGMVMEAWWYLEVYSRKQEDFSHRWIPIEAQNSAIGRFNINRGLKLSSQCLA